MAKILLELIRLEFVRQTYN